jgi:hypothetical protein
LNKALADPESALAEGEKLYGLPIFWSILQDAAPKKGDTLGIPSDQGQNKA